MVLMAQMLAHMKVVLAFLWEHKINTSKHKEEREGVRD